MKRLWLLAALLVALAVKAEPPDGAFLQGEDFQDDTVGDPPTAGWYSYLDSGACSGSLGANEVTNAGLNGTSKSLLLKKNSGGTGNCLGRFTFSAYAFGAIEYYYQSQESVGAEERKPQEFFSSSNSRVVAVQSERRSTTEGCPVSNGCWLIETTQWVSGSECDTPQVFVEEADDLRGVVYTRFDLNWEDETFDYLFTGSTTGSVNGTAPFCKSGNTNIARFDIHAGGNGRNIDILFDEWRLFDQPSEPDEPGEDPEPTFSPRPVEPGGIFGDNGAIWGGDKSALAATLEISETGLETAMAAIWILLFTALAYLSFGRSVWAAMGGATVGFVWSIAWGLLSMWIVFFALVLGAGGYFGLRRRA